MAKKSKQYHIKNSSRKAKTYSSYEKLKQRILVKCAEDLSAEIVANRIQAVRIESRYTEISTTLTPGEFLSPFTI